MFAFQKILGGFLMPLPFCLFLILLGLLFLWSGKRLFTGKALVTLGALALALVSYSPISRELSAPLQRQFNAYPEQVAPTDASRSGTVNHVVVLAGGHQSHPSIPITGQMNGESLKRLLEGIRVHRSLPGSKLILTGGGAIDPVPEAVVMGKVAAFLGVDPRDMILEPFSMDTHEHARMLKPILKKEPFVLVTSAVHLPRAMALFQEQGMKPIPAPAGSTAKAPPVYGPGHIFPNAAALEDSSRAVHEYLGLAWARLRGQI